MTGAPYLPPPKPGKTLNVASLDFQLRLAKVREVCSFVKKYLVAWSFFVTQIATINNFEQMKKNEKLHFSVVNLSYFELHELF